MGSFGLIFTLTAAAAGAAGCDARGPATSSARPAGVRASTSPQTLALAQRLGRGINFGNALERPRDNSWGFDLEPWMFDSVKEMGFASARLPIRWSAHAAEEPRYTVDEAFFARVEGAVSALSQRGLAVIINVHHYDELFDDPDAHEPRLVALWGQIAGRFQSAPPSVIFELLNEPHGKLTPQRWNAIIAPLLAAVRATNPTRTVMIGPGQYNSPAALEALELPDDPDLIVSIHYYEPMQFTHQGASWVGEQSKAWLGTTWNGTEKERALIDASFDLAAQWARERRVPMNLGEFGAYSAADMQSRARWTRAVRDAAESRGFSALYWEFGDSFGVVDRATRGVRTPLLDALMGP